jgi:RHS repeat-associated protein
LATVFFFASQDGLAVAVAPVGGGWLGCVAGTDEDGPKLLGCAVVETAGHQGASYANPHAATSIGSDALTYDENGNLLTKGANNSYAWDYANRLASSATGVHASAYAYDASGTRVKLVEDGTTTLFPSGGYEVTGGIPTKHVEANGVLVATVVGTGANAVTRYVHTDHLTGSNVVTSQTGAVDETLDYYPYGGIRIDQKAGTFNERRKFAGHEYDQATGLSYMGARYYDAAIGRFLSQDPAFLAVGDPAKLKSLADIGQEAYLSNPQFANSYAYSLNNPVTVRDESGNFPIAIVAAAYAVAYAPVWVPAAISAVSAAGAAVASWNLGAGVGHAMEGDHAAANRSFDASVTASTAAGLAAGGILAAGEALGAGLQSKEGQGASAAKQAGDTSAKVHGNSLQSTRTNYGYTLRDQDTKQILKFGETQNPVARYSQKYLDSHNAFLNPETSGSKSEVHQWQHNQITQYKAQNGNLPPLNKSEW